MARVELPKGIEGADNLPRTWRKLLNCFYADGKVLSRPGINGLSSFSLIARGSFKWNDALYAVYGTDLVKITDLETGAATVIGTVLGSDVIKTAIGFNHAAIIVKGGAAYTLDKSDVLTDISGNPNMVPAVSVVHIDGRFVYIPANGDPAFFSDVGDAGSIQPLSFFDAETLPDRNKAVFEIGNTLFIAGENSIELFRNVGSTPNPFQRIQGAALRHGFIGGLLESSDTYLFLGREKDQDFGFYGIGPGKGIKISNERIDKILAGYSAAELADCVASRFKWRGYDIATFTLPRDSFGFLGGNWFRLDTVRDGFSRPWMGGYITEMGGKYYSASLTEFGRLDPINTDFGNRITRTIDYGFEHPNNRKFSCQSIELGISQGYNDAVGTVAIMMSRDNVDYGPALYRELGALGKYHDKLAWNYPGGLGNYDGFMGVRIYTTEDVTFAADSLYMNIR